MRNKAAATCPAYLFEFVTDTLGTRLHSVVTPALSGLVRVTMLDDQVITTVVVAAYASLEVLCQRCGNNNARRKRIRAASVFALLQAQHQAHVANLYVQHQVIREYWIIPYKWCSAHCCVLSGDQAYALTAILIESEIFGVLQCNALGNTLLSVLHIPQSDVYNVPWYRG